MQIKHNSTFILYSVSVILSTVLMIKKIPSALSLNFLKGFISFCNVIMKMKMHET